MHLTALDIWRASAVPPRRYEPEIDVEIRTASWNSTRIRPAKECSLQQVDGDVGSARWPSIRQAPT
jgi:hypothetical protein